MHKLMLLNSKINYFYVMEIMIMKMIYKKFYKLIISIAIKIITFMIRFKNYNQSAQSCKNKAKKFKINKTIKILLNNSYIIKNFPKKATNTFNNSNFLS